jgi:hypothetical protein
LRGAPNLVVSESYLAEINGKFADCEDGRRGGPVAGAGKDGSRNTTTADHAKPDRIDITPVEHT